MVCCGGGNIDSNQFMKFFVGLFFLLLGIAFTFYIVIKWSCVEDPNLKCFIILIGLAFVVWGGGMLLMVDYSSLKKGKKYIHWICDSCGTENTPDHVYCWQCRKENPIQDIDETKISSKNHFKSIIFKILKKIDKLVEKIIYMNDKT